MTSETFAQTGRKQAGLGLKTMFLHAAAAVAFVTAALSPAQAQVTEGIDPSKLNNWRIASGNVIRFCQVESNLTNPFDRAVAEEVAARLLVDSSFIMLQAGYGLDGDGLETDIFIALVNECEVVLGLQVTDTVYAPEFTVTRPYVGYRYIVVARDAALRTLEDFPPGVPFATQIASAGDLAFSREMATRPPERQVRRLPYGSVMDMFNATMDGSVAGMLIFAPVYVLLAAERPEEAAQLHVVDVPESIGYGAEIGGLLMAQNTFLRTEIDAAIASMVADGTIAALLKEHGYVDIPASPGGF